MAEGKRIIVIDPAAEATQVLADRLRMHADFLSNQFRQCWFGILKQLINICLHGVEEGFLLLRL